MRFNLDELIEKLFSKKLFKKEIKGNILLNLSLQLRHLIITYKNFVIFGGAVIIVIIIGIGIYINNYEKNVNEANKWFESSLFIYRRAFLEQKLTTEERMQSIQESINRFQYVINTFPNTPLKYDALMYQGNAYFEIGDYNNALQKYQQIIDEKANFYFADFILINIAKCYEQLSNIQAAVDTYNKIIKNYKKKPNIANAMFNLGKIYELSNKINEAFQMYQQLIQQFPYSVWSQEARRRILFLQTLARPK
ncbi:MAG: tetratricopeptide repeat protein [bacterium]|nr:tetratricopeptide repeat protein [bacterium]